MAHQRQSSNSSLRELLNQFVNTFINPFDAPKRSNSSCCKSNISTEVANARLSKFEKTYVSFPEFEDISSDETRTRKTLYNNNNDESNQLPPTLQWQCSC